MDITQLLKHLSRNCLFALLTSLQTAVAIAETDQEIVDLICVTNLVRRELKGREGVQHG